MNAPKNGLTSGEKIEILVEVKLRGCLLSYSAKAHAGEIMAQTQTAVHCRKEAMGDLPSIQNSSFLFTIFRFDQFEG